MMKPTVTILVCVVAAGLASAQSPSIIQNTRNAMNGVSNNAVAASKEELGIHQSAPAAPSATQAPAKSSGVPAATPVKVSSTPSRVAPTYAGAKKTAGAKRVSGVVAGHKAQAKPVPMVPKSNPPAAASAAHSSSGNDEGAASEVPVVPDSKYTDQGIRVYFIHTRGSHSGVSDD